MYYNLRLILDNIKLIASAELSNSGQKLYPGVRYISREETAGYSASPTVEDYIGVNELVCTGTLNRCFSRIYKMQSDIAEMLQDRNNSEEFYNDTTMIMKKAPVHLIDHKLPQGATHRIQKLT